MNPLVLYHSGCRDGFAAAWVAHWTMPDAEFRAVQYGQPAPIGDAIDRNVYVLDFCYPLVEMLALAGAAKTLTVLDHHITAEAAMREFKADNATVVFDMNRSGAGITWDHFNHGASRPWLVNYVEDRDLWRFALPDSEAVNAWLSCLPFDFATWSREENVSMSAIVANGSAVALKTATFVAEVRKNARRVTFEGFSVPCVNAAHIDISELVGALSEGEPFAMGWWQCADGKFSYSLRSRGNFDVSEIAKRYGGGGHRNAAGFVVGTMVV